MNEDTLLKPDEWLDYGLFRIFEVENKYGKFFKTINTGDDPQDPLDGCAYGRDWRVSVALMLMQEAERLLKDSKLPVELDYMGNVMV